MLARQYSTTLLRVGRDNPTWLTFDGKFVPYGYVPAALRVSAYLLEPDVAVPVTIPTEGAQDGVTFDIEAKLSPNGDATLRLTQIYAGQYASALRQAFLSGLVSVCPVAFGRESSGVRLHLPAVHPNRAPMGNACETDLGCRTGTCVNGICHATLDRCE
jgi:hypothetical protein